MGCQGRIWVWHGNCYSMGADYGSSATMSALFTLCRGGGRGRIVAFRGGPAAGRVGSRAAAGGVVVLGEAERVRVVEGEQAGGEKPS